MPDAGGVLAEIVRARTAGRGGGSHKAGRCEMRTAGRGGDPAGCGGMRIDRQ